MVYETLQSQQFLKIKHQLPIPWNMEVKGGLKKNEAADKYGIRNATVSTIFKNKASITNTLESRGQRWVKEKKKQLINMVYQTLQSQRCLKIKQQLPIPWKLDFKSLGY